MVYWGLLCSPYNTGTGTYESRSKMGWDKDTFHVSNGKSPDVIDEIYIIIITIIVALRPHYKGCLVMQRAGAIVCPRAQSSWYFLYCIQHSQADDMLPGKDGIVAASLGLNHVCFIRMA